MTTATNAAAKSTISRTPERTHSELTAGAAAAIRNSNFTVHFTASRDSYQWSAGVPKKTTRSAPAPRNVPNGNS